MNDPDAPRPDSDWVVAEKALLGAVLVSGRYRDVEHLIGVDDLQRPAHGLLWEAFAAVTREGTRPDPVAVMAALTAAGTLRQAGGTPYLHELEAGVPTGANIVFYARLVQSQASTRRLVELGTFLTVQAQQGADTRALEGEARRRLSEVHARATTTAIRAGELVDDFLEELETPEEKHTSRDIEWPYRDVNQMCLPLRPGQLIYIGARPGTGKTISCMDVARAAAVKQQKPVMFHSLEMSAREVMMRLVSAEAGVNQEAMQRRQLVSADWQKIAKARGRIDSAPLFIDDRSSLGTADVRAAIRSYGSMVSIVDYIGSMQAPKMRNGNRREEMEANSRELKIISKEEGVAVVAAAQLNRSSQQRQDKTPDMSDLREAGGLEQDADMVVLLHRDDYYEKESVRVGEVDFIVAKQRGGKTGTIPLAARLHQAQFADLA